MKRLYIQFEFNAKVHGICCKCNGTRGYDVINDDGSYEASEYAEALNRINYILGTKEDCMITFGDDLGIEWGEGKQYGRIIRNWTGGSLSWVLWDEHGNMIERVDNGGADGSIPERTFARTAFNLMVEAHKQAHPVEAEADLVEVAEA